MTDMPVSAAIGLGGNLGDAPAILLQGLERLAHTPDITLVRHSRLYRTAPIGPPGQPDYANAAALVETRLAPEDLLDLLQGIEQELGRVRDVRWGARTLDLDLLLYGSQVINTSRLSVPHREMHTRAFVLVPLAEIAADRHIPGQGMVGSLAAALAQDGIAPWPDSRWPTA